MATSPCLVPSCTAHRARSSPYCVLHYSFALRASQDEANNDVPPTVARESYPWGWDDPVSLSDSLAYQEWGDGSELGV